MFPPERGRWRPPRVGRDSRHRHRSRPVQALETPRWPIGETFCWRRDHDVNARVWLGLSKKATLSSLATVCVCVFSVYIIIAS